MVLGTSEVEMASLNRECAPRMKRSFDGILAYLVSLGGFFLVTTFESHV